MCGGDNLELCEDMVIVHLTQGIMQHPQCRCKKHQRNKWKEAVDI